MAPARGLGCRPASAAAGWREPSGHALLSRGLSCRLPDWILSLCLLLACVVSGAWKRGPFPWPRLWGPGSAPCLCSSRKPGPALPSSCCRSWKFLWAMGGKLADEGLGLFRGIQKHSGHLCPLSAGNVFRNKTHQLHPATLETAAGRPHCAREHDHRNGGAGAGWVLRAEAGPHHLGSQHVLTRLEPRGGPRSPPTGCRGGWALLTPAPSLWTGDRPSRSQDTSGLKGSSGDCGFQLARAEKGG